MADTDALFSHYSSPDRKPENVVLSGLVLNEKGLERGLSCGVDMFCMGVSASETHSNKNTGMSTDEALSRILPMAALSLKEGKKTQVSVQSAFGCGFEGRIDPQRVLKIVGRYLESGLRSISLADTAGHATPPQVERMFEAIFKLDADVECTCHFHNTYGLGMANCYSAMRVGVKYFETAFAGLGGCPFTKVAAGNVCTEDFVHFLQQIDQRRDVRLDALIQLARDVGKFFGREMPGLIHKAGPIRTSEGPQ
jgi:hydroxymethylglutaryl-CoA lyase